MNFYTHQHKHYCGIDLHAKAMYVCILDQNGTKLVHKNLPTTPEAFLRVIAPYTEDIVVGVECMFTWYWLADLCQQEGIAFVLGHALYMKAIHGGKANREDVADHFPDPSVHKAIEIDVSLIDHYDQLLNEVEGYLTRSAKTDDGQTFARLQSVPGIGQILALVLLYEIHDIRRFPRVQDFVSYCRLVKCAKESNGKRLGTSGKKIGNVHLRWVFAEAAVLFLHQSQPGKEYFAKLEHKHGKAKALTVLAQKLGRAVYDMLTREQAFALQRFVTT